ncbi:helicase-related protein [Thermococcus sp. LS2]|uniref:helicase-related protein n=1 Tax=Thermococcus sp. LS2 TaxID=1638260 RepID=UPI00143A1538|nr:helicase-related protein [Thermococcus sp. LS2]NJE13849.1 hypothetical protein [Thermococcus sp. LS2]
MVVIIDNTTRKVADYIKEHLKKSKEAKFALGYFFLSGWDLIKESMPENPKNEFLKIIMGDETTEGTAKEIEKGYKLKLKTQLMEELSELKDKGKLNELYNLIKDNKVNIKIYNNGKLHAKLYLFLEHPEELCNELGSSPGVAIVGSSNFTRAGLAENKELNVLFTDREAIIELNKWFDELWMESEDFKEELLRILKVGQKSGINIGKFVTPEQLFKLLVWKWFDGRIEPIEKRDILAEFQLIGVINAIDIINKHNGVIIADSVGLGKSFIGATIIEEYMLGKLPQWDPNNYGIKKERKVLLILPPSLIPQWEHLLFHSGYFFSGRVWSKQVPSKTERYKTYEIYQKVANGVVKLGEVSLMSLGIFSNLNESEIKEMGLNYEYDLILIDEAHKFRNRQTKRWKNARLLRFKDDEKTFQNKFILLTATPLNNTIWDIYNLIKLFSDDFFSTFKERGRNVTQLFNEFKELKKKWKENPKYEPELRKKAQEIKEKVLDEVMILRTRRYIQETFREGEKIKVGDKELLFKEPEPEKVTYTDVPAYREYESLLKDIEKYFEALEFAYTKIYTSGYVIIGNSSSSLFEGEPEEVEEEFVRVPISTILKLLIAKRLESSIFAFERTLTKMYEKNNQFYQSLSRLAKKMNLLTVQQFIEELDKTGNELLKIAGKDDVQEILEEEGISSEEYRYPPKLRMLLNILSKGFGDDVEASQLPLPKFRDENEFYEHIKSRNGLIQKLRLGIMRTVEALKKDKEIMEKLKERIEAIKIKDNGRPRVIEEVASEEGRCPIYEYRDPKLEKLKELMYNELKGRKYIIFTQYKDTAVYLYHTIRKWAERQGSTLTYLFDTKRGRLKIGLVTGELSIEEKERIIKRFAPMANNGSDVVEKYGEIMVLISTDSLSEGVNLQDADGVINYDLPWNPMIIVQRVGRVNRIGSTKDVFVKNFVPVQEIELSLGLLAKLQEKIKDITLLIGKEFYILSPDEEISIETFGERLKSFAELKLSQLEEVSMGEDFKFIRGGIPDEVLAEFELLDFVQNKLGLKKEDFEDIQPLLKSRSPIYTLVGGGTLLAVFEIYRGKKRVGKKVVAYRDGKIEETTCREFMKLWNAKLVSSEKEPDFGELAELLNKVDTLFRHEILPKHRGSLKQKGLLGRLYEYLKYQTKQKRFDKTIDEEEVRRAKTYLGWAELNTKEIKEFKEFLLRKGALKIKGNKLEPSNFPLLVRSILEYFGSSEIDKKLTYKIIGWWY